MEIKSTLTNRSGQTLATEYHDIDSLTEIRTQEVDGVHAIDPISAFLISAFTFSAQIVKMIALVVVLGSAILVYRF